MKQWPVARQLLVLQALLLAVVLAAAAVSIFVLTRNREQSAARDQVLSLAQSIADNPFVAGAAVGANPSAVLQPYAEQIRIHTKVDFVVIMAPDRIRFTHPDTTQIGKPFIGHIQEALQGRAFTETFTGTLGSSVRAVAPVRDASGRIVALVAVGVTTKAIRSELMRRLPFLLAGLALLLAVALAGALLVSRRLRRQTRGLDSDSISRMYSSYQAVLHSVREGLLVIDADGRVGVINDEGRRLLGLRGDIVDRPVRELDLADTIKATLLDERDAVDELHLTGDRVLVLNQSRAQWGGRSYGTVATFRDRTELEALTGELDATKAFAEALHSQAHEAANRLHTMVVLVETGRSEDAVAYATTELELSQRLTDQVVAAVEEPVLVALLLGKAAQANERGVELTVTDDSRTPAGILPSSDLVTIVGNLIDNAIDASAESSGRKQVTVTVRADEHALLIQVEDTGPGLPHALVESAFTRGWSTKISATAAGRGLGLALVNQVVRRHGGSIDVSSPPAGGAKFTVRLAVPNLVEARL
ncbi:MAG: putative two-component system sensor kinase [Pseudonocardiales bacterium]|nr:putative two-component system sensor kinase [Pseudonocardiales bacterium]